MVGAAMARSTRSGTFVGPGIWRKCRPLWYVIRMSLPGAEPRGAAAKIPRGAAAKMPRGAAAKVQGAELAEALRRAVGGEVRFDSYTRHLFSRDASMYAIEPIGVVFPRDADDVSAVISTAADFEVPVLARGAGTSLAGQTVGQAIVMDFSRHMNSVIE